MTFYGNKEIVVAFVTDMLMNSAENLQSITIMKPATSEGFCAFSAINSLLDADAETPGPNSFWRVTTTSFKNTPGG